MTITCPEVTYVSTLFVAVVTGLVGYLTPYWQVDDILTEDSQVEIAVGLNYACIKMKKEGGALDTYCKPIPIYGANSYNTSSNVEKVRWLMTWHMIVMVASSSLYMSSFICVVDPKRKKNIRAGGAILAVVSLVLGISGLVIFSTDIKGYQNVFEAEFPDIVAESVLIPGNSCFLSGVGCALFGVVCSVDLALRLRELISSKRQDHERKLLLKDEIRFVYGSAPFFLDAASTSSLDQNGNKINPLVETCRLDIFEVPVPVHNSKAQHKTHIIYAW